MRKCNCGLCLLTIVLLIAAWLLGGCASRSEGIFLSGAVKYEEARGKP